MIFLQQLSFDVDRITDEGTTIALVGYLVVFSALILLFAVFSGMPKLLKFKWRREQPEPASAAKEGRYETDVSGELNAAVGMALHMYFNELHDEENLTLTIERVSKRYSPWSSKIYSVVKDINRKF